MDPRQFYVARFRRYPIQLHRLFIYVASVPLTRFVTVSHRVSVRGHASLHPAFAPPPSIDSSRWEGEEDGGRKEGRKEGIVDDPPFILHLGTPVWQRAAKGNGRYHLSAPRTRYESQRSNHSDVIRETTGEETQKNEKLRGEAFKRLRNGTLYVYRSRENSSRRGESESSRGRRFDFRLERLCRFAHRYDNNDDPLRSRRLCLLLIYRSCELRTRACRIYKGFGLDDTARHCQWQTVSVTAGLRYLVASAASKGEIIHSAAR